MKEQSQKKGKSGILFIVLLLLYVVASVYVTIVSRTESVLTIGNQEVPLSAFTGVFSSIANLTVIFLVVFFGKAGFVMAIILLLIQFPMMVNGVMIRHNLAAIPGFFTNFFTIIAVILIHQRNRRIDKYQASEIESLKEQQRLSQKLFEQTATSLVNAIDAKDTYSHGHSLRVAEYSRMIAETMGKNEEECYRIYYAALLHDVGKIGIDDRIINKKGKLTDMEYEVIKQHPAMGAQILSGISEYPYLSIGACHHHERYDGKGYPDGLHGEEIPEIARIISVADAYDAMTSNRSYRDAIPQQLVREEIVKGIGTQFDPTVARVMQHLIDMDTDYQMKEQDTVHELGGKTALVCEDFRSEVSDGIVLTPYKTKILLNCKTKIPEEEGAECGYPALVLFDSLDGRYHEDEKAVHELLYYEYGEIRFDGSTINSGARKMQTVIREKEVGRSKKLDTSDGIPYVIEGMKFKDHVLIRIDNGMEITEVTVALPDSSRYAYIGLTGERCSFGNIRMSKSGTPIADGFIPRIADEISFIDGIVGDIPNVQVDGYRTDATEGIPITDGLSISFHSMSLPTARLVWHCAYIDIFTSNDQKVNGENYREYSLIRLDGENWEGNPGAENAIVVTKNDDFESWEAWKRFNKAGVDCTIRFSRKGNKIVMTTENLGLSICSTTTIKDGNEKIYVALTGDQCAITDIRIHK